jgi:hypothetical protein
VIAPVVAIGIAIADLTEELRAHHAVGDPRVPEV